MVYFNLTLNEFSFSVSDAEHRNSEHETQPPPSSDTAADAQSTGKTK